MTFPEQYSPELAGKDATFKVKVHTVREPQLPELDDEFAKDVSEFDTLEEYKADLRTKLYDGRVESATNKFHSELLTKACDNMDVTVPESMISEKTDEFLVNYANNIGATGRNRAELIQSLGLTEDAFEAMMRPSSERQVKTDLLLDAIAKAEGIEATEEDKKEFYDKLAADYGEEADKIKEMIDENLMTQDIIRRKAAEVIYESAVKTEPKPAEEEGEEAAPAEEEAASTEEAGD